MRLSIQYNFWAMAQNSITVLEMVMRKVMVQ